MRPVRGAAARLSPRRHQPYPHVLARGPSDAVRSEAPVAVSRLQVRRLPHVPRRSSASSSGQAGVSVPRSGYSVSRARRGLSAASVGVRPKSIHARSFDRRFTVVVKTYMMIGFRWYKSAGSDAAASKAALYYVLMLYMMMGCLVSKLECRECLWRCDQQ